MHKKDEMDKVAESFFLFAIVIVEPGPLFFGRLFGAGSGPFTASDKEQI